MILTIENANNYLQKLSFDLHIDIQIIIDKTFNNLPKYTTQKELIDFLSENCAHLASNHYDYSKLAARIIIHSLNVCTTFSNYIQKLYELKQINEIYYNIVMKNEQILNNAIVTERDYNNYDYFAIKTLQKLYLKKIQDETIETPQYLLMRTSLGIHGDDIEKVIETYDIMSNKYMTHASPTIFSAAAYKKPQMSSCYLLTMSKDSISGIYDTLKQCMMISKYAGGIGLNISNIRSNGSKIISTNGTSNGIIPMIRTFNNAVKHVNQGNKRPGAISMYLEPWHPDIFEFLQLKKNTGVEELRARDLFYALWIPDLFMERFIKKQKWSLMCPYECPGLSDVYGEDFKKLYEDYEKRGMYVKQIDIKDLWKNIIAAQIETGTPYMLYKDSCNIKSNQSNLGTIKCSNLCAEIVEYTSSSEIAVCNLASIAVNMFVNENGCYDFNKLKNIVEVVTANLNKIIDKNYYPVEESKYSNLKNRPIGIGIQGLADLFCGMRYPYESDEAKKLNVQIFETIYFAALNMSCNLAKENGKTYDSYKGSPASMGILQYDLWNVTPTQLWDWENLKLKISKYGLYNSLFVACMPTASTAQIMGNYESFEPIHSNFFQRHVQSGTFPIINKYLVDDLIKLGLWNDEMKNLIIYNNGSVQNIKSIPENIRNLYKTVWEISMKRYIDMSADRGAFVDQSQSLNIYMATPNSKELLNLHYYGWKRGLKTGMYYLRTKPASEPTKFTVDETKAKCSIVDCTSCGA